MVKLRLILLAVIAITFRLAEAKPKPKGCEKYKGCKQCLKGGSQNLSCAWYASGGITKCVAEDHCDNPHVGHCIKGSEVVKIGRTCKKLRPLKPCTCKGRGGPFCPGDKQFLAPDGCNKCNCNRKGLSVCTKKACPQCTCKGLDGMYCPGESGWPAPDGCNTCTCNKDGTTSCTEKVCGDCTCEGRGGPYCPGVQEYKSLDGCNDCNCMENGISSCTKKACPQCTCQGLDGMYCPGDSFASPDGCNTCTCTEDGLSLCTLIYCPPPFDEDEMNEINKHRCKEASLGGCEKCVQTALDTPPDVYYIRQPTCQYDQETGACTPDEGDIFCPRLPPPPPTVAPLPKLPPRDSKWPELLNKTWQEATQFLEDEYGEGTLLIPVVPEGSVVTADARNDRVRLWVDKETETIVVRTPQIG